MNNYVNIFLVMLFLALSFTLLGSSDNKDSVKKHDSLNTTSTYSQLCLQEDLYGLWKVVRWIPYFEIHGKDWNKPAFMKNQWFLFDGKGGMKSIASNMELPLDDVKRRLSETKSTLSVILKRKGFFDIASPAKGTPVEHWRCSLSKKKMKVKAINTEVQKGDLIMTMLGADNTIRFFRQLRRVEN